MKKTMFPKPLIIALVSVFLLVGCRSTLPALPVKITAIQPALPEISADTKHPVTPPAPLAMGSMICGQCSRPITSGPYIAIKKKHLYFHRRCWNLSTKDSLTGLPIPPGSRIVKIGREVFLASEYAKAEKCSVSGLPLVNRGKFLQNSRRGDKILIAYLGYTRKCLSCRDQVVRFAEVDADLFVCDLCLASYQAYKDHLGGLLNRVQAFFRNQGLKTPKVALRLAGAEAGLSGTVRGKCLTNVSSRGGSVIGFKHQIRVLRFLDKQEATLVLAHEYTHALINEHKKDFDPAILADSEGLCEFVAYTFSLTHNFPAYMQRAFATNTFAQYSQGFKRMKKRAGGRPLKYLFPRSASQ